MRERCNIGDLDLKRLNPTEIKQLRLWASYRAQTLSRTIRGIMRHEKALHDLAVQEGYDEQTATSLARQKFCYVVSCQIYS